MALRKITSFDTFDKGVVGLPDAPNLSVTDLQKKFDELATDVIIPIFNTLVDQLMAKTGASEIGARAPDGIASESTNIQDVIRDVYEACKSIGNMMNTTYDKNKNGIVDDSERLGGELPAYYQPKQDSNLQTYAKNVVDAINELNVFQQNFSSVAVFAIDDTGHYVIQTLQTEEIIQFATDDANRLVIYVN